MKKMHLLLSIGLCFSCSLAFSQNNYPVQLTLESTVKFLGNINLVTVNEFIERHADSSLNKLIISSEGGDVAAGMKLGKWVKEKNLDVEVAVLCMSACANYIFVAGKRKIIKPNALVIWHGSMEQKNIRDQQTYYEVQHNRADSNDPSLTAEELQFLIDKKKHYDGTKRLREEQARFFESLGVNELITRLGQEPVRYPIDGWAASLKLMEKFGIKNVEASDDYGTVQYMKRNILAKLINHGDPMFFDINNEGNVYRTDNANKNFSLK